MKEISKKEQELVYGGILPVIAGAVSAYYGEKAGRWLYKKLFA